MSLGSMTVKFRYVAFFLIPFVGFGQNTYEQDQTSYYDSLLTIAHDSTQSIDNRAVAFNKIAFRSAYSGFNSEKDYTIEYLRFSEKHKFEKLIASAHHLRGYVFLSKGQLDSAEATYIRGLNRAKKVKNVKWIGELSADLGVLYTTKGEYEKAETYHRESIAIAEKTNSTTLRARGKINLGELFETQGKYQASLSAFQDALRFCERSKLTGYYSTIQAFLGDINLNIREYETAQKHYNLAYSYASKNKNYKRKALALQKMGTLNVKVDRLDKAQKYYEWALSIANSKNSPNLIGSIKSDIAALKLQQGKNDEAKSSIEEAILLYEKNGLNGGIENIYLTAASIYDSMRLEQLAKSHYLKSYQLAVLSKNILTLKESSFALGRIYHLQGNVSESIRYYQEYIKYDLLKRDEDAVKEILRLNLQDDFKEKYISDSLNQLKEMQLVNLEYEQKQESEQLRSSIAYISISALVILVLLIGFLFFQKRKSANSLKTKNDIIEQALEDKELLLQEVHHRVKNNMQVVSSVLRLKSRNTKDPTAKAILIESQERIDSMRLIHQQTYKKGNFKQIDAAEYCKDILALLLFPIKTKIDNFLVESEGVWVDIEQAQTLGFIVYELITNSIKHAWEESEAKRVRMSLSQEKNAVVFNYSDNGKGLPIGFAVGETKSTGMNLIVALVKRQLEGEMEIETEKGFGVTIRFDAR